MCWNIDDQIAIGRDLLKRKIQEFPDFEQLYDELYSWHSFNRKQLEELDVSGRINEEYGIIVRSYERSIFDCRDSFDRQKELIKLEIQDNLNYLSETRDRFLTLAKEII